MSIYAYVGLPGSGKSYGVVANQILPALKDGRQVVTNLPLKVELLREFIPGCDVRTFNVDEIAQDPERCDDLFPPGAVVVIDEVWRLWPAGQKVDKIPEAYKSLLAEHRHRVDRKGRSMQIVLVCQDLAQIAAFARQLVEQTFVHRKLGALGMRGRYTVGIYEGNVTGLTPPESKRINSSIGKYAANVWRFYQSHTMSESATEGADETAVDERGTVWKRPILWLGLVAALVGFGWGGTWVYGAVKGPGSAVGGDAVGARATADGSPSTAPARSGGAVAVPAVWRVSAYLKVDAGQSRALVTNGRESHWVIADSVCRINRVGELTCRYEGRDLVFGYLPPENNLGRRAAERVARLP